MRLEITVADLHLVEKGKAFEKLARDLSGVTGTDRTVALHILTQVAVRYVFHHHEDKIGTLIPAEETDK